MTHDDIIRMAREAGFDDIDERGIYMFENFDLERFAQLVAAAEREACAKICEEPAAWYWGAKACAKAIRARGQQ